MFNNTNHKEIQKVNMKNGAVPIACSEMCFFCFDVLSSHLHGTEPPAAPNFTNEPL